MATARFLAKADGVLSGIEVAKKVFQAVDKSIKYTFTMKDGDEVKSGTYFGTATGPASSLLVAERTALNLMQRMSGIATLTRKYVKAIEATGNTHTKILDTRKTAPGMRMIDKKAVRDGGALNHRTGLYDMVMIKDNHITAAGGVAAAISAVEKYFVTHLFNTGSNDNNDSSGDAKYDHTNRPKVEVETRTLDEVKEAVKAIGFVDRIMLDNMVKITRDPTTGHVLKVDTSMLEAALKIIKDSGRKVETEASGNVTLETVGEIGKTGVDYISSGQLTHSVTALDISLKIALDDNTINNNNNQ